MQERERVEPVSPTAIGMQTGMDVPGWETMREHLAQVRGPMEEVLFTPPPEPELDDLDMIPGQSGAEGMAELPHSGADDPWDGP